MESCNTLLSSKNGLMCNKCNNGNKVFFFIYIIIKFNFIINISLYRVKNIFSI